MTTMLCNDYADFLLRPFPFPPPILFFIFVLSLLSRLSAMARHTLITRDLIFLSQMKFALYRSVCTMSYE